MEYLEAIKLADHVDGSLIELGFGKGNTLTEFISYMNSRDVVKRDIQLYDSFEGYPSPVEEDENAFVKGGFKRPIQPAMDIRNTIKKDVKLIKGFIEDTLEDSFNSNSEIAIIHSDLVSYSSTLYSLTALNSKLSIDGVVIVSGYSKYPGVKLAVDSFISSNKKSYRVEHTGDLAVLVKVQYMKLNKKVTKDRHKISW
jgi:hypothetical protein